MVWLPDLKTAAYTVLPFGLTARARGVSPKSVTMRRGTPPNPVPSAFASNTQTSARPTPGVVSCGSPAPGTLASEGSVRCWPRWAVVMKARLPPGPAKTMSRGSSPTSSVRVTRGGSADTSTMLTLSDRLFTTQTSFADRAATATGSMPTGTEARCVRPEAVTSKISRRSSGVSTTNSWLPSGERASGRT